MDVNLSKLQEIVKDGEPGVLEAMRLQRVGHDSATEHPQQASGKCKPKHG